jgi:hypothetical protein
MSNKCKAVEQIMKFQTERQLDQMEYDWRNETLNSLEELFEQAGYDIPKTERKSLSHILEYGLFVLNGNKNITQSKPTEHDIVDGANDEIVFAIGKLMKLGYDPELALQETAKEINSRIGTIHDGKFQKLTTPEAIDQWYKADYSKAKINKKETK